MTYLLAQFPLQIVVFPQEIVPLHIFEPRYKQLVEACESEGIDFGIVPVIDGVLKEYGTVTELKSIDKRYADGRMDIQIRGKGIFHIEEFFEILPGKLYGAAQVTSIPFEDNSEPGVEQQINLLMKELYAIMRIPQHKIPDKFGMHQLAHKIGFSLAEEYKLLCSPRRSDAQKMVIKQLERILPRVREMEEIRKKIELNGDSRHIIPPKL